MNINDVTEEIEVPKDIWPAIYNKQMELALKYQEIEGMGDLLQTLENNIDTAKGQKWIKDFAWRTTEELAEAFEAFHEIRKTADVQIVDALNEHFKEELIDGLHFLTELTIIAGYDENFISSVEPGYTIPHYGWDVVYYLGLLCNTLKNKPWKQSQMLTDRNKFESLLRTVWEKYKCLLHYYLGDDEKIFRYYFKKHRVNEFRQRSNY